jgi:regulatory protein
MRNSDPFAAALRLLTKREHSIGELADRLRRKGFDEAACSAAIARCRELGYVDDARFARSRARQLLQSGRAVGRRLLLDLQQHGIPEEQAREVIAELEGEFPRETVLLVLLERRFPHFDYQAADDRERRRVVNYFLRRGFALAAVLDLFKGELVE